MCAGFLLWGLACVALAGEPATTVYKYLDAQGVLHLTNRAPPAESDSVLLYARSYQAPPPPVRHLTNKPRSRYDTPYYWNGYLTIPLSAPLPGVFSAKTEAKAGEYATLIEETALRHGLDPALLHAVVRVESGYNPQAVSPKGATGLMQLMPGTALRYGVGDASDPRDNLQGGARYLADLLKLFDGDLELALAGYNAGENAVLRHGKRVPPYLETEAYVRKVQEFYRQYRLHGLSVF